MLLRASPASPISSEKGRPREYTENVEALGITEEQAKALGIGENRGHVYCAMRYESGAIAGFLHLAAGKLVLPKNLLPDQVPNVVPFQKRA